MLNQNQMLAFLSGNFNRIQQQNPGMDQNTMNQWTNTYGPSSGGGIGGGMANSWANSTPQQLQAMMQKYQTPQQFAQATGKNPNAFQGTWASMGLGDGGNYNPNMGMNSPSMNNFTQGWGQHIPTQAGGQTGVAGQNKPGSPMPQPGYPQPTTPQPGAPQTPGLHTNPKNMQWQFGSGIGQAQQMPSGGQWGQMPQQLSMGGMLPGQTGMSGRMGSTSSGAFMQPGGDKFNWQPKSSGFSYVNPASGMKTPWGAGGGSWGS